MERGWSISGHVGVCGICTAGSVPWHGEGTSDSWKETLPRASTCKNCRFLWTCNIIIENWNSYTKETLTTCFFALICTSKHWFSLIMVIKAYLWFPAFWLAHWSRVTNWLPCHKPKRVDKLNKEYTKNFELIFLFSCRGQNGDQGK